MDTPTYLAKAGKVTGPFDTKVIEEMKRTGEFYKYEWMWDGQSPEWSPVPRPSAPPPALPEKTKTITRISVEEVSGPTAAKPAKTAEKPAKTSTKTFYAVLFDSRVTVGGEVTEAHARGGRFTSTPTNQTPASRGANVLVDLLDEKTDRSTKIQTTISKVSRMGDRWVIDLEWSSCPLLDP